MNTVKKVSAIIISLVIALVIVGKFEVSAEAANNKAPIVLESYEAPSDVILGETTTIKLIFKNEDELYNASNVLLSYSSTGNTVIPATGTSNQVYLSRINIGKSIEVEIPIVIVMTSNGYADMQFTIEYISDETRFSQSSYIVFPVTVESENTLAVKNVNVIDNTYANVNTLVSVSFSNLTGADIYNAKLVVSGDINGNETSVNIGTINNNRSGYGEAYVSYSSAGDKNISLLLSYDDADGKKHEEIVGDYSVSVYEVSDDVNKNIYNNSSQTNNTSQLITSGFSKINISYFLFGIAGVLIVVIVVVIIISSIRKKK